MSTLNTFKREDSGTNTVLSIAEFYHTSSGTPASGLGSKLVLGAEDSAGNAQEAVELQGYLSTVTSTSEQGEFLMRLINAGAMQTVFSVTTGSNTVSFIAAQTTLNLFNTVATTVNAFGAATINMGATGSTHTLAGTWSFNNNSFGPVRARRAGNTVGFGVGMTAYLNDSGSNAHEYAAITGVIETNTDGSEAGALYFYTALNAAATSTPVRMTLSSAGNLALVGDLAVNGGDMTTSATTFNMLTATATTVNAFTGASTALTIGHASAKALINGGLTIADAKDIALNTTTGTKIGTATSQKLALWNQTPIVQPSSTGEATGYTGAGGTALTHTDTFTGNSGTKAYTLNDVVKHLKAVGILAAS